MTATDDLTQALTRVEAHLLALSDDAIDPDTGLNESLAIANSLIEVHKTTWGLRDRAIRMAEVFNRRRHKARQTEGNDHE